MYNNKATMMAAAAAADIERLLTDPSYEPIPEVLIVNIIGAMEECAEKNDLKEMRSIKYRIMKQSLFIEAFSKDEQTMLKACYTYHYRLIKWRLELIRKSKE